MNTLPASPGSGTNGLPAGTVTTAGAVSTAGTGATVLGSVHDIPLGEGRTYAVGGEMIAVFRLRDGSVRALAAVCPHRGGPLADGQIDLRQVVCPMHLFAWDLATGCSLSGQDDIRTFPVYLVDDLIMLGADT